MVSDSGADEYGWMECSCSEWINHDQVADTASCRSQIRARSVGDPVLNLTELGPREMQALV